MRVALLAPSQRSILGSGVRALSAWVRRHGHQCRMVFLPADVRLERDATGFLNARYSWPDDVHRRVAELCADCDLVGISLFTCFFDASAALTRTIHQALPGLPVVWGGVHPTVRPEECLDHADYVCVGEGEDPLLDLLDRLEGGGDLSTVPNVWTRRDGVIVRNAARPPRLDMDHFPAPDMDLEIHYTRDLRTGRVAPLTPGRFRDAMHRVRASRGTSLRSLVFLGSRGCHLRCGYCVNSTYQDLYGSAWAVNRLSMPNLLAQVEELVERYPFAEEVEFADDDFAARPLSQVEQFCEAFPRRVGLPFHFLSTPALIRPERVEPMKEAGCFYFQTGVQTATRRTLERYDRRDEREQIRKAADYLHRVTHDTMPPCYHVILDDPLETPEETLETLRFVNSLPRPFWMKRSALVPFPGTPVHAQLEAEGLVDRARERQEVYARVLTAPRSTPINVLFRLISDGAPPSVVDGLLEAGVLDPGSPVGRAARWASAPAERGMAALQRGRRWLHLGAAAVERRDSAYLLERLASVATGPPHVPTSMPPG